MKNNYKVLIIIILLFSLLFILLRIFINEDSNNDINSDSGVVNPTPEDDTEESGNVIIKDDINNFDNMLDNIELNKLDYVKDYDYFFTVNDIVNRYLGFNYVNQGEVNYLIDDYTFGNAESLNKLYRDNDYNEFVVDSMKVYDNGIIQNYFVSGYLAISGMDGVERQEKAVFVVNNHGTKVLDESLKPIGVYAKYDENGNIIEVNSDIFIRDLTGWTKIDEGYGDRYAHAQSQYFNEPLFMKQKTTD